MHAKSVSSILIFGLLAVGIALPKRVPAVGPRIEPKALAAIAPIAVAGFVTSLSPSLGPAGITTTITIDVTEVVKESPPGTIGSTVQVEVFGGTVGNISMSVEDSPVFVVGEEVIVLLEGSSSPFTVVGGAQGKFEVKAGQVFGAGQSLGAKDAFIQSIR